MANTKTKNPHKKQEYGKFTHTYSEAREQCTQEVFVQLLKKGLIDLSELADKRTRTTKRFLPFKDNEDIEVKEK